MRTSGAIAVLLFLLYGGLSYWQRESMLSPGHLIEGHGEFHQACLRCHSAFGGVATARCVACHPLEEIGLRRTDGAPLSGNEGVPFHRSLREGSCVACHTDHAGPDADGTLGSFEHGLLVASALEACNGCHERERPGDLIHTGVKAGCRACHQAEAWKPATFDHEPYFRFDGNHPEDCGTCHTTGGDLGAYTCYGCHEHTPRNIRSEHLEEGIREFEACEECHRSADEEESERAWKEMRREIERSDRPPSRRSEKKRAHDHDDHGVDGDHERGHHREHDDDD